MSKAPDRRAWWIAAVVALVVVFCLWWFRSAETPASRSPGEAQAGVTAQAESSPPTRPAAPPENETPTAPRPKRRTGEPIAPDMARLRARVLGSLGAQPRGDEKPGQGPSAPAAEQKPGGIQDRTGELNPETMRVMNDEFMPLVRECYDLAHARNPQLRGMLAVDIELAGAEELGTIIEAVEPAQQRNELDDAELIECVRQSAFSLELPMPLKSGRVSRQLTLKLGE